jgi:hypothetical protein
MTAGNRGAVVQVHLTGGWEASLSYMGQGYALSNVSRAGVAWQLSMRERGEAGAARDNRPGFLSMLMARD